MKLVRLLITPAANQRNACSEKCCNKCNGELNISHTLCYLSVYTHIHIYLERVLIMTLPMCHEILGNYLK